MIFAKTKEMTFKDRATNICALITIVSGAFVTLVALPLSLPAWTMAMASFFGTVATGYSQWLTGKGGDGKQKQVPDSRSRNSPHGSPN